MMPEEAGRAGTTRPPTTLPNRPSPTCVTTATSTGGASVGGRTDLPSDLESAYAVLVDEASDLPGAAEAILLGVQAPDNGTQRRTAVTVFVQETLAVVYAIATLRRGGWEGRAHYRHT